MEYGKFATAEELLKGYNELEKSFTQKCQQLAVMEKQIKDGTNVETSPSNTPAQSTTVDSAETVPQSGVAQDAANPVLSGRVQEEKPTDEQVQQFLENNPDFVSRLLHKQNLSVAPSVMSGGGNVSLVAPSKPKTIKEASAMAKHLFE